MQVALPGEEENINDDDDDNGETLSEYFFFFFFFGKESECVRERKSGVESERLS